MPDWLRYANQGATRNQPLSPELIDMLGSYLPGMGVSMEVFSGGQPSSGPNRVGSHRHDYGNAADVFFSKGDRRLDWANAEDLPVIAEIVSRGRQAGVTGWGAGEGYMQPGSLHVGLGSPSVWGRGGHGENAPAWLKEAYYEGALKGRPQQYALQQPEAKNPLDLPPLDPLGTFGVDATQMASANAPSGPVEAAGGGAGNEAGPTQPPAAPGAPEGSQKGFWDAMAESAGKGLEGMAAQPFNYDVPAQPGAARVDVPATAAMVDPQQAEMRRQMLAMAMQRLNTGSLWG